MNFGVGRRTLCAIALLGAWLGTPPTTASGDPEPKLTVSVPLDGAWVGAKFVVKGTLNGAPKGAEVHVGTETARVAANGSFELTVTAESEGARTIRVLYGPVGEPAIVEAREVTVDLTPPRLDELVPAEESAEFGGEEATISGRVVDVAPAPVRVNGRKVKVAPNGRFESIFVLPAEGEVVVTIEVADAAGNVAPPVVRKLRRMVDRGPPSLNFGGAGVSWVARNGATIALVGDAEKGDAEKDARAIGDVETRLAPLGTFEKPMGVEVRATAVTPYSQFWIGWGALKLLKGNILAVALPSDPATASVKADVIDLFPALANDGSWSIRVGSKVWTISADDVRDSDVLDQTISATMADTLDAVGEALKASKKFAIVRLRCSAPTPRRLFELTWLAGYVHARSDVIVERLDLSAAEPPSTPASGAAVSTGAAVAVVSFERERVVWLLRDGGRIEIPHWSVELSASIEAREREFGPFGTSGQPTTVAIRAAGVTPKERFQDGWLSLFGMRGIYQVQVPPPDPATKSVGAVVVDVAPSASNDGSWTIRMGTRKFVAPASFVKRSYEAHTPQSDETMSTFIDLLNAMPDPSGSNRAVRIRTPRLVPLQLFDEIWRAVAIYEGVIVESAEAPVPTAAPAPARLEMSAADRLRREAALAAPNEPMAVAAAKELADAGCVEAIPALRKALGAAGAPAVRGAAARALGRLDDLDSVPVLIELLKSPDGELAADVDAGLSSMSGLGRMLKSTTPLDQRVPIAERYARWWKGAEAGLRRKKAAATPSK